MLGRPGVRAALGLGVAGLAGVMASVAGAPAASAAPTDQIRSSQQWVLNTLDVPAAWEASEGSGVTVAVIDSGVDPKVSDLIGSVTTGPDLTGLKTPPGNPAWGVHGTWMASIIAGHGHNGGADGIIGVAPEAKILSIRVIPDKGDPGYHTYDSEKEQVIQQSLATGITDAVRGGAKVISMSIGYSSPSSAVRSALQYAEGKGVVLVASSGNSGQDDESRTGGLAPVSFPADYPGVISVGALSTSGAVASFSSNNLSVQVAAPGVNVPAQGRDGQYWLVSGTSPACALVAGVAALIKARYPRLAPPLVAEALTSTARSGSSRGYNPRTGFGTVDAAAALNAAGRLAAEHPVKSPVAASATFGGGLAAVPAPPVKPRAAGQLILFAVLGLVSSGLAAGGGIWLVAARRASAAGRREEAAGGGRYPPVPGRRHEAAPSPYGAPGSRYDPPGYDAPGYAPPGAGYGPAHSGSGYGRAAPGYGDPAYGPATSGQGRTAPRRSSPGSDGPGPGPGYGGPRHAGPRHGAPRKDAAEYEQDTRPASPRYDGRYR